MSLMRKLMQEYEPILVSQTAIDATDHLLRAKKLLGDPTEIDCVHGWRLMDEVMRVWLTIFPKEVEQWKKDIAEEIQDERSTQQLIKDNGNLSMIGYPPNLFKLTHVIFPLQKLGKKDLVIKMVRRYPLLKATGHQL